MDDFKPDKACGALSENTAASEATLNCRQTESINDSFDFEFQSWLHECETKTPRGSSTLLISRYTFVCRLFFVYGSIRPINKTVLRTPSIVSLHSNLPKSYFNY